MSSFWFTHCSFLHYFVNLVKHPLLPRHAKHTGEKEFRCHFPSRSSQCPQRYMHQGSYSPKKVPMLFLPPAVLSFCSVIKILCLVQFSTEESHCRNPETMEHCHLLAHSQTCLHEFSINPGPPAQWCSSCTWGLLPQLTSHLPTHRQI